MESFEYLSGCEVPSEGGWLMLILCKNRLQQEKVEQLGAVLGEGSQEFSRENCINCDLSENQTGTV